MLKSFNVLVAGMLSIIILVFWLNVGGVVTTAFGTDAIANIIRQGIAGIRGGN